MISKLIVGIICLFGLSFFILVVVCYFVLKFLKLSIDDNNIFFYKYNKKCQKILNDYGDCKINNLYLVRQPIGKSIQFIFNLLTLFNYKSESPEKYSCHPSLLFELKKGKHIKFIVVEKNNCVNIADSFIMSKLHEIKKIKPSKSYTLNAILQETQSRVGNHTFFNWNLFKNNCQEFTKEILITLHQHTPEYNTFIVRDKLIKYFEPSELNMHVVNCVFIIINFIEKYVFDNFVY